MRHPTYLECTYMDLTDENRLYSTCFIESDYKTLKQIFPPNSTFP